MDEHLLGQGQFRGSEHGLPDDGLVAQIIRSANLDAGPPFLKALLIGAQSYDSCIVCQRVKPDVDDLFWIIRNGNSPRQSLFSPGDTDVRQSAFDKVFRRLELCSWFDKIWILLKEC